MIIIYIFSIIVIQISAHGQAETQDGDRGYEPALTQAELREFTERMLDEKTIQFSKPRIVIDDCCVHYDLGGLKETESALRNGTTMLRAAMQEQFRVSLIRRYRPKEAWKDELIQVEAEIGKILSTAGQDEESRLTYLSEIHKIYDTKIKEFAESLGKEAMPMPQQAPAGSAGFYPKPGDAVVERMVAGEWELYQFLTKIKGRKDVQPPRWTTCQTGENALLLGKYWIKVTWSNGKRFKALMYLGTGDSYEINYNSIVKIHNK